MELLRFLLAALLLQAAAATPDRWTQKITTNKLACTDHPTDYPPPALSYTGHGFLTAVPDPAIVFTVTPLAHAALALPLCLQTGQESGAIFDVQVAYTLNANLKLNMFLTTSAGALSSGVATAQTCGVGSRIVTTNPINTHTQQLTLDCPSLTNVTSVILRATMADGSGDSFHTNTLTLQVDTACIATLCANYVPPPPAPSPSPAPPVVDPNAKPVYPECINAKLLANPCPLGKRCFYDLECKPQTEDLVSPNCGNAAPLPNPWQSGKCCFYDSQCKPQCEDKTNSKCTALNIPACSVTGCGWCSATNPAVCERCWTGYTLNLVTGKCDCAPGYYGSTSCKKCAAGSISYGGQLSPTASCTPCPPGRVANKEQTECVVASSWDHWGYDLTNRRWGYGESKLNVSSIANLQPRWSFTAGDGADVTATPTIANGRVYFPDWAGNLWCLDAITGSIIWTRKISDLIYEVDPHPYPPVTDNSMLISRTSPAISGGYLVVGTMKKLGGYPYLLALDAQTGNLTWGKRVEAHAAAMLTMSPTVHAGFIYQGISSLEELWATIKDYPCCSFRGSFIKVDLSTGNIVWRTWMAPDNNNQDGGFSGNSLWGSSPALDIRRNQLYIATGNNYETPDNYTECLAALGPITTANIDAALACESTHGQGNYHNSMMALDMDTGAIRWNRQLGNADAWNGACAAGVPNANCKDSMFDLNSPDYDFGQAPMLVKACNKGGFCKQLVVAGQKSGWLWALNPDTGSVHWSVPVGPGGTVGGLQWGSAADNNRIYVANNNYLSINADLTTMKSVVNFPTTTNQRPPTSTDGGLAAAVDAYTGEILWTFANPTLHWDGTGKHARSQAPMTVVNDVVFYPSMDLDGTLFMLDARTGKLLNSYKTGSTSGCGPAVVDGRVYVGSGYANFGLGKRSKDRQLHMLSL